MVPDKCESGLASNDGCNIVHFVQQEFLQAFHLWIQTLEHRHHEINEMIKFWVQTVGQPNCRNTCNVWYGARGKPWSFSWDPAYLTGMLYRAPEMRVALAERVDFLATSISTSISLFLSRKSRRDPDLFVSPWNKGNFLPATGAPSSRVTFRSKLFIGFSNDFTGILIQ